MWCILSVFFSLKCSLFHNSNLFGSCIIDILYTECAKIKKIILAPKGNHKEQYECEWDYIDELYYMQQRFKVFVNTGLMMAR